MECFGESGYLSSGDNDLLDEDIEAALYAQIHFEENTDYVDNSARDSFYEFQVDGNDKSGYQVRDNNSDVILNKSIGEKYETPKKQDIEVVSKPSKVLKLVDVSKTKSKKGEEYIPIKYDIKRSEDLKSSFNEPIFIDSSGESDVDSERMYAILDISDTESEAKGKSANIQMNIIGDGDTSENEGNESDEEETGTDWKIIHADTDKSKKQASRYYKPFRCLNCNEVGHMSKQCPKPKKQVCGFCSENGHIMRNCPESLCFNCDGSGHDARDCRNPKRQHYKVCFRCDYPGHQQARCPDHWRQYHLTTNASKMRKGGPVKRKTVTYCYNCAGDDHYGHECDGDKLNRYVQFNAPFISRYSFGEKIRNREEVFPEGEEERPASKKVKLNKKQKLSSYIPASYRNELEYGQNTGRANFDKMQDRIKKKKKSEKKKAMNEKDDTIQIDITVNESKKKKKKNKKKNRAKAANADLKKNIKFKNNKKKTSVNIPKYDLRDMSITVHNDKRNMKMDTSLVKMSKKKKSNKK